VSLAARRERLLGKLMGYASIFVLIFGWVCGMSLILMLSRTMDLALFAVLFALGILVGMGGLLLLYRRKLARPAELAPAAGAPAEPTGGTA
jgi:hypothetical protein